MKEGRADPQGGSGPARACRAPLELADVHVGPQLPSAFAIPAPLRGVEPAVAGEHLVGEDAAVAPAADPEALGVGHALRHGLIDRREHVRRPAAPVGLDPHRIVHAAPGTPRGLTPTTAYPLAASACHSMRNSG